MGRRRLSRERALQALYQMDATGKEAEDAFKAVIDSMQDEDGKNSVFPYAGKLVYGVVENAAEIDELIRNNSANWRLERMATVDRNVLRIAAYELLYCPDIPHKVVLNEAIEVAKKFGSEESGSFINGLLDKIVRGIRPVDQG